MARRHVDSTGAGHRIDVELRARIHAALGDPARLAIVDDLLASDRSPKELGERHGIPTNLLAHHLDALEAVGLITRFVSAGDRRRRYVRLRARAAGDVAAAPLPLPAAPALFLCSHNSARSQLAAAIWTARTGEPAESAGTHPAARVHRGACGRRPAARPRPHRCDRRARSADIPAGTQVVTVCDRAHEELEPDTTWWHWSIPDPVEAGTAAAFDAVVADLDRRIATVTAPRAPHRERSIVTTRIGINGFGRIGRLVVRALPQHPELELVHVNEVEGGVETAAHLLEFDTVHGRYAGCGRHRRRRPAHRRRTRSRSRPTTRPAPCRGPSTASTSCSSARASSAPASCSTRTSSAGVAQGRRRRTGEEPRGAERRDGLQRPPLRRRPCTGSSPPRRAPRTASHRW